MTLEVLFAQASQGRTFLLMMLCGLGVGVLVHVSGLLHRVNRCLGMVADLLCAFCLAAGAGCILLQSGEGLRLYGLLGMCIGGVVGGVVTAWGEALVGMLRGGQRDERRPPGVNNE